MFRTINIITADIPIVTFVNFYYNYHTITEVSYESGIVDR